MVDSLENGVTVIFRPKHFRYSILISAFLQYFYPWNCFNRDSNLVWWISCVAGISIAISGYMIAQSGLQAFKQIDSSPKHGSQIKKLQTNGIFKITRNPLYLAMGLLLFGFGIALNSLYFFVSLGIFWPYVQFYVIPKEEKKLQELFGQQYEQYQQLTGQWITVYGTKIG
eukprot:TRINITY_DN5101_c0_g1_i4.p2 TRINITY_DN5101_c0_g1~~TRINITY_DN5101_c0_g1_i4.p2  ORF type:complete len:170 (-),score=12.03 TRINITY_DN5101_c0_g1_i4:215-724(-)